MPGWKAVIRQLEDQLAAGPMRGKAAADQAEGLLDFANRMLKTPYAATPMRPSRRRQHDALEVEDDTKEDGGTNNRNNVLSLLQRLEDSMVHMRGELGVWVKDARYLTLHGGLLSLCEDHTILQQNILGFSHALTTAEQQADSLRADVQQVWLAMTSLSAKVALLTQS